MSNGGGIVMGWVGTVTNGVVVLPKDADLPDGAQVEINPVGTQSEGAASRLTPLAGVIDDLPEDFAERHDDYLRGKRRP